MSATCLRNLQAYKWLQLTFNFVHTSMSKDHIFLQQAYNNDTEGPNLPFLCSELARDMPGAVEMTI